MSTEKKLSALFDFQRYSGNAELQGVIDSVHARYASAGRQVRELSFEEMDVVFAAGQQVTTGQLKEAGMQKTAGLKAAGSQTTAGLKAPGRIKEVGLISGGNDDEHA